MHTQGITHKKLIVLTSYATIGMLGLYMALYQYTILNVAQMFFVDAVMMGIMIGMQHLGMSIPPLLFGILSRKFGKKTIIVMSYALLILGTFIAGASQNLTVFVISVFIIGAGYSVIEATLSAVLSDEFPENSTRHMNFTQIAFSTGALAGPFLTAALINKGIFFKDLYMYCSVVFLLLGIVFLFTKCRNSKVDSGESLVSHLGIFFRSRVFLLLACGIFLYVGIENTIASFCDSYFVLHLGSPDVSAYALALYWGALIPSRLLAGIIKLNVKKMFISISMIVFSSIIFGMMISDSTAKVIAFAFMGFGCGPIWPLLMDTAAKNNRGATGSALNIMFAFSAIGGASVPLISSFFVSAVNQTSAYYLSATIALIMLGVYLLSVKKRK